MSASGVVDSCCLSISGEATLPIHDSLLASPFPRSNNGAIAAPISVPIWYRIESPALSRLQKSDSLQASFECPVRDSNPPHRIKSPGLCQMS